jgi:hypothetical protein
MNPDSGMPVSSWNIPGIKLVAGDAVADTWGKVTYDPVCKGFETEKYLLMLNRELLLYPPGYHLKAGIFKIVLGENLAFNREYRGAVPDPYRKVLYLSLNGSYGENDESYLVHILHHEVHHMVEYAVWKDMYFEWAEWKKLNPEMFSYSAGGSRFSGIEPDYYTVTHPLNGFLNLYSMTGGEEDRCELAAFIMSDRERPLLIKYLDSDLILQRKVRFISDFINNFAGVKFIDIDKFLNYPGKT